MKACLVALVVVAAAPVLALGHEEDGSYWENGSFEEGEGLDTAEGTPEGWRRSGSNPALCTVTKVRASSGKYAIAVEDTDAEGYGEWYAETSLNGVAEEGELLEVHWREIFDIQGGEMRVTVLFWNEAGQIATQNHFVVRGQSAGWADSLATSRFVPRDERIVVPAGAVKLSISLVSGGSFSTTGLFVIDEVNLTKPPQPVLQKGNLWPNSTFEEGSDLNNTTGTPSGWKRGGNNPKLLEVSFDNSVSPTHSLAVNDTDPAGFGEWYSDFVLAGRAAAGDLLKLQWFEAFDIKDGEMRLTVLFLGPNDAIRGERHYVAKGQSAGWPGHPHGVPMVKRNEELVVPEGAITMRVSLVSGGSLATTGLMYVDDFSLAKPTQAEVVSNNFWPNSGFEEGVNLDQATGTPAGWNRGGNGPGIDQVTKDNAKSPTHALIVRDDSATQFGEWYSDLPLAGKAEAEDSLNLQWFEAFQVKGGEMRVSVLFFDTANAIVGQNHFVTQGDNSQGWKDNLANSPFQRKGAQVIVPKGASKLRVSLVSGGSAETTGLMAIDDLSIARLPKGQVIPGNFWPNPTFEIGAQLDNPLAGQPAGWNRGGTNPRLDQVLSSNSVSPSHALAVIDDDANGFGEWYQSLNLEGKAKPGDTLNLQWHEIFDTTGTMRFSFLFFDSANAILTQQHFLVNGQSDGWKGSIAASTWTKRNETLEIPENAVRLQVGLVTGGGFDVTGSYLIDDFSVGLNAPAPLPANKIAITGFSHDRASNEFTLEWISNAQERYSIQFSTDMEAWSNEIDAGFVAVGPRSTKTFKNPGPVAAFFRVKALP